MKRTILDADTMFIVMKTHEWVGTYSKANLSREDIIAVYDDEEEAKVHAHAIGGYVEMAPFYIEALEKADERSAG